MKILYATDGRPPALDAARLVEKIARRDGNEISVISVNSFSDALQESAPSGYYSAEAGSERAVELTDLTVEQLRRGGFAASGLRAEGDPGVEIVHAAESGGFDLTIVGAGSSSWLGQILLGSTSTYVLHSSPTSVLVVHRGPGEGRGRLVVGVDGSSSSESALRAVEGFADPQRCEVILISAVKPPRLSVVPGEGGSPSEAEGSEDERRMVDHLSSHARQNVSGAATRLSEAGFTVEERVAVGDPAEQLLEEADKTGADLIALGSRGRSPFKRAALGSVSDKVARLARATLVGRDAAASR